MLNGKRIVLGVTGGIAAYKAALLVRLLVKSGAEVKVVMTRAAHDFVTPLTLGTLSKNPVLTEFVSQADGSWNNHVELGLWADLIVIAPATAHTLAQLAHGQCDNLLLAVCLSARCPLMVAPAMDVDMYRHAATQSNLQILRSRGTLIVPPGTGELASGLSGEGRLAEPEDIVQAIAATFAQAQRLNGKHILVTAGPTYEAIDPVRFIGNHSTGKMGFALAETLAARGAEVTLVTGPVALHTQHPRITRINITSAQEMYNAATAAFDHCHAAILSAAVADFRPQNPAGNKIKKEKGGLQQITLEETPDTLAELGRRKKNTQVLAGFALETDNEEANAQSKLERKNLDFIVLNSLRHEGAGFGKDTNRITLLTREGKTLKFELKSKSEVAADIADYLQTILK
ncbi:MAG: bifunctional phosphopantothenoylcysteine decarboxylase/phosphopantothenate--cysteine ligase CoaBC [Bacteroidia bacterium]|nr:bifunctional phosphopantothenoylcysteine decarboxylase/phosphopantothenate--cysteine ligase CoaBC [Bacteroidia bacterium]